MKSTQWLNGLDRLIAGRWWWQLRRRCAEDKLNGAQDSAEAIDFAYQEWKRYEFACKFGRVSEKEVADAVQESARNGTDPTALALLVVNCDIHECDGKLKYRHGVWLKTLGFLSRSICFAGAVMFAAQLALAPMPLATKLGLFLVIFSLLIAGAYVLELYTTRPLKAAAYLEGAEDAAAQREKNKVISLHDYPDFKASRKN